MNETSDIKVACVLKS